MAKDRREGRRLRRAAGWGLLLALTVGLASAADEAINWERASELFQKSNQGQTLRAPNRTPRGRDGADLVAGQEARATRIGDQCVKPERHRHATKDARPCGLRLGPFRRRRTASKLLAVPDPSTSPSPLLAAARPEAQRGSRGVLLEALRTAGRARVHWASPGTEDCVRRLPLVEPPCGTLHCIPARQP